MIIFHATDCSSATWFSMLGWSFFSNINFKSLRQFLSLFFFTSVKMTLDWAYTPFFPSLVYVYWSLPMLQALCIFSFTLHSVPCGESYYHHFTVRNMLPGGYVTCLSSTSLWQPPLSLEVTHMAGAEPAWQPQLVRAPAQAWTTYLPSYIDIFA